MTSEFNLIKNYFTRPTHHTDLGIGDDAALIQPSNDCQLVVSADLSVVGTHFLKDAEPYDIGWKALSVNLSDMAAMGATPKWFTLSIALPNINDIWLLEFSRGLFACAKAFDVDLIGGDTTRGPLNIGIQIIGEVPIGKAIKRSGAKEGDDIWLSGHLGSASLGLAYLQKKSISIDDETRIACVKALNIPQPRVALGLALRDIAHSCIDVSDGLLADLSHILKASSAGAKVQLEGVPCLPAIRSQLQKTTIQRVVLTGGDDYELCFTASPAKREHIMDIAIKLKLKLVRIGTIDLSGKLSATYKGQDLNISKLGYDHFN